MEASQFYTLGNQELLHLHKTAFLCSRTYPASVVLKAYDWAIALREQGKCVISGFHSQIEQDALHYLLKGTQPIIVALARGFKQRLEPELQHGLNEHRLLLITPFDASVTRITARTAYKRNQLMVEVADDLLVAFVSPEGSLQHLIQEQLPKHKRIATFEFEENTSLLQAGAMVYQFNMKR